MVVLSPDKFISLKRLCYRFGARLVDGRPASGFVASSTGTFVQSRVVERTSLHLHQLTDEDLEPETPRFTKNLTFGVWLSCNGPSFIDEALVRTQEKHEMVEIWE